MTGDARRYWDEQAETFDDEVDHGLWAPEARRAWTDLLGGLLPAAPARVADLGCGTGSLAVLLAEQGYEVSGIDLAPAMVAQAVAKARRHGVTGRFAVGDAAAPDLEEGAFDVVLARHVVWALPDPATVLARWRTMLAPGGRMVLVEGFWSTGAGITARELASLVAPLCGNVAITPLPEDALWGRRIDDERYVVVARP